MRVRIGFLKGGYMEATIEKWFHLKERGTSVRTELIAGMTTFVTVAYILAVNPSVRFHGFGARLLYRNLHDGAYDKLSLYSGARSWS